MLERRDQELIGEPPAVRGQHDEAAALDDEPLARSKLRVEVTADRALAALFGSNGRRRLLEPGELSVAVRKARAGLAPLVQENMQVGKARFTRGSRSFAPSDRDPGDLALAQFRERADVSRCRDDYLVMLEDRVEVRNDADRPARCVRLAATRTDREGLRRRSVLPALAERARGELLLGRQVEICPRARARPPRPARRDDDPLAGDRVLPELSSPPFSQLEAPPPFFFFSMKGLSRSIGAGKTIVVDCEPPSSSSVCR
jgi:hypothetical protein